MLKIYTVILLIRALDGREPDFLELAEYVGWHPDQVRTIYDAMHTTPQSARECLNADACGLYQF